jgi:hypothetical protein
MKLWRTEISRGPDGSPYRIGAIDDDGTGQAPGDELTTEWVQSHLQHLKLDRVVELTAAGNGVSVRSVCAVADREAPPPEATAAAIAGLWKAARPQRRGILSEVTLDGHRTRLNRRPGTFEARPVRIVGSDALAKLIAEKNRPVADALVHSLKSSMGVIPFVGAGISAAFNFPQWGDLLNRLAGPAQKARVARLVRQREFERAAELLYDRGRAADRLQEGIAGSFERAIGSTEFTDQAAALLPYLTAGPVITTNYDRVLEGAFERAHRSFTRCIIGAEPDEIVPAIQRNERVLFKIHGDCETRRGLTLTLWSYEFAYGQRDRQSGRETRDKLRGMLPILLTNRPFLFLGCSLETDRTLEIVKATFQQHARVGHYAILAADVDADAFEQREEMLARIGIRVLWYMPGQYAEVRALLRNLLEAISIETLKVHVAVNAGATSLPPPAPVTAPPPAHAPLGLPPALRERIRTGNVLYFLGAAASGELHGGEFYKTIARNNNVPEFVRSRSDIAQHIVDRNGRATLVSEIVEVMRREYPKPSDTHRRFAALAIRVPQLWPSAPRVVMMTTNYDGGLEMAFEERLVPHHLFVYQPHGDFEGRFVHRTPSGDLRVVVRPENLHELEGTEPVIIKLNGGMGFLPHVPHAFAVATRDFYRLAAKIPSALPAFLIPEIAARSLLFLAHGLREPDVEELIRFRHGQQEGGRSWALKWRPELSGPDPDVSRYWAQVGVDVIWGKIDACMSSIEQAIEDVS